MECHKCKYNGKQSNKCLECLSPNDFHFEHGIYLDFDVKQHDTSGSEKCTPLSEEDEDKLRKAMFELFELKPLELLLLQGIMHGKTLTEFADSVEKLSAKNQKCSRHHAFQLRKSLYKKIPLFQDVLLTNGQRKPLKTFNK